MARLTVVDRELFDKLTDGRHVCVFAENGENCDYKKFYEKSNIGDICFAGVYKKVSDKIEEVKK